MTAARAVIAYVHYPESLSYFRDWLDAFVMEPRIDVRRANLATPLGRLRFRRSVVDADLVILLHSVVGDSLSEIRPLVSLLQDRRGKLAAFVANELSLPSQPLVAKLRLLEKIQAEYVCTQLLPESGRYLYADIEGANVVPMPHALNPEAFASVIPPSERPIDIGFRGARYLPHIGDNSRNRLIDLFESGKVDPSLTVDIRTDIAYGRRRWSRFLNRCRGTIGAESGSAALRRDDEILSRTESQLGPSSRHGRVPAALRPVYRYVPRPVKNTLRRGAGLVARRNENEVPGVPVVAVASSGVDGKCLSSRHFEAIGTGTCQILIRGRYNDLLEADRHYLALDQDLSNVDDVLKRFRDNASRIQLVTEAREWALDAHTYHHRVRALLDAMNV